MFKKLFLFFLITLSVNLRSENLTPENTVFAIDLHGVVLNTDYMNAAKTIISYCKYYTILRFLFNPFTLVEFCNLARKTYVVEKLIDDFSVRYPNILNIKQPVIDIINCQTINEELVSILIALKSLNYKIYILSNIGTLTLECLKKKNSEFVNLFDDYFVPGHDNNYIHKPNADFFRAFKDKFDLHDKRIIFLDDLSENIKTAKEENYEAILFKNNKQAIAEISNLLSNFMSY